MADVTHSLIEGRYQFLSAVTGKVSQGKYIYYNATVPGTILLELTSISGDADLYVSQKTKNPTWDHPNNYCLQSVTFSLVDDSHDLFSSNSYDEKIDKFYFHIDDESSIKKQKIDNKLDNNNNLAQHSS
ncbi:hypothetical protein Phum_PHUM445540 [Pediculus humanus corporis]|uniref:Uncharacterized protein n=1 Tax=Pediculus humanus subsp. corporis TaxID=121224 RepID=E0VU46_PEDHC|nr:uncharacterized protein Phum_PHUM445540 [Pediculus humanus corporis]EEB16902.1 hypothetical protein Phum_PHUM445540 [Pediculus humanus corporis]